MPFFNCIALTPLLSGSTYGTVKDKALIELDIQYEDKEEEVDTRSWVGAILAAFCLSFTSNCNLSDALCFQNNTALH